MDDFWHDLTAVEAEPATALGLLGDALAPVATSALVRERLVAAAAPEDRLARYAAPVAEILDLEERAALELIRRTDRASAWIEVMPGIAFLPVPGGPRALGALRAFVRVRAGVEFPVHEHLGDEAVLIMQGHYEDPEQPGSFGPGDVPRHRAQTQHSFRVLADGPDLLGLVVAYGGLRALGQDFLPRD